MHVRDTDYEVAEDALETLERLVSEGDLAMASVTYEIVLARVATFCDPNQFERLRAIEDAINQRPAAPGR